MSSQEEPGVGESRQDSTLPVAETPDATGDLVRSLLRESREVFSSLPDELSRIVSDPLEATLQRVAEGHATLVARLEGQSDNNNSTETLRIAGFRKAALVEVSAQLLETVQRLDAATIVGSAFADRLERLREVAKAAPDYAEHTQDSSIPDSTPDEIKIGRDHRRRSRRRDGIWSRLGQTTTLVRWIFKRKNNASGGPPGSIPLRQLLHFHVDQRLTNALLPLHEAVQQKLAQRYAALERSDTEWAFALLDLDEAFGLEDLVTLPVSAREANSEVDVFSERENGAGKTLERVTKAASNLVGDRGHFPFESFNGDLQRILDETEADLHTSLDDADKLMSKAELQLARGSETPASRAFEVSRQRWVRWYREVVNRILLNHSVLTMREDVAVRAARILRDTRGAALDPVLAAFDAARLWIDSSITSVAAIFDQTPPPRADEVVGTLKSAIRDAANEFERLFPDTVARDAQNALTDIGGNEWEQLVRSIALLPEELPVHSHMHESAREVDPNKRPFSIDLREIANNTISPAWPGLLSEAAEPLRARITRVWSAAEKLRNVIDYNLGAAIDELLGTSEEQTVTTRSHDVGRQPDTQSPFENAKKLATDALRRSAELIDEQRESLREPWSQFAQTFDTEVHSDWTDLINQVKADDFVSERWTGLRTQSFRLAERLWERAAELSRRGLSAARKRAALTKRIVARLIRRGRFAVGVTDAGADDTATIAEDLRSAEAVKTTLPLVYRRLFSFGVLSEPALLVGRGRDLVHVRRRFENWSAGKGPGSLVIRASLGSGRTSFLEALRTKLFEGSAVHKVTLSERVANEHAFSKALAGLELFAEDANLPLDRVGRQLTNPPSGFSVILLDNFEHLLLQAAGGTDILRQVLTLMLRTDHAVFWVGIVSDEAWRYIEKAVSSSAASVGSYALADFGRQDKEDLILKRHNRSGMSLEFTPPKDPTPLLKRRLRSARTQERQQEILQENYFDALHRQTGNNITLALLYWLRSVEFKEDGDLVVIRPFDAIGFNQLKSLDLERLFALKALILHNTLTATELGAILRIPVERSAMIFETLVNLALVEQVDVDGSAVAQPVDTTQDRLKLSRLAVYPVIQRLRDARVLY